MALVRATLLQMRDVIDQEQAVGVYELSAAGRVLRAVHFSFVGFVFVLTDRPLEADFIAACPNFKLVAAIEN